MRTIKSRRICIVCEGYEEIEYMQTLVNKAVFSSKYDFVLINSKSMNNILDIYRARYQSNSYDLVLVFCDTDKLPSEKYREIKHGINRFHNASVADKLVIFGNPCTMQIILSHFADIKITSQSKSINGKYIKQFAGIENYKATDEQRKELFGKIKKDNYQTMKENVAKLSICDEELSSTNILEFLEKFENDNDEWIDKINIEL